MEVFDWLALAFVIWNLWLVDYCVRELMHWRRQRRAVDANRPPFRMAAPPDPLAQWTSEDA